MCGAADMNKGVVCGGVCGVGRCWCGEAGVSVLLQLAVGGLSLAVPCMLALALAPVSAWLAGERVGPGRQCWQRGLGGGLVLLGGGMLGSVGGAVGRGWALVWLWGGGWERRGSGAGWEWAVGSLSVAADGGILADEVVELVWGEGRECGVVAAGGCGGGERWGGSCWVGPGGRGWVIDEEGGGSGGAAGSGTGAYSCGHCGVRDCPSADSSTGRG